MKRSRRRVGRGKSRVFIFQCLLFGPPPTAVSAGACPSSRSPDNSTPAACGARSRRSAPTTIGPARQSHEAVLACNRRAQRTELPVCPSSAQAKVHVMARRYSARGQATALRWRTADTRRIAGAKEILRALAGPGAARPCHRRRARSRRRLGAARGLRQHVAHLAAARLRQDRRAQPGRAGPRAAERPGADDIASARADYSTFTTRGGVQVPSRIEGSVSFCQCMRSPRRYGDRGAVRGPLPRRPGAGAEKDRARSRRHRRPTTRPSGGIPVDGWPDVHGIGGRIIAVRAGAHSTASGHLFHEHRGRSMNIRPPREWACGASLHR